MGIALGRAGSILTAFLFLVASLVGASSLSAGGQLAADAADLSGVVEGQAGGDYGGVWVIAETDDLSTKFRKIVVTDDDGRFLVPDLPDATYDVWVRGYGLADSAPVQASPGDELTLHAVDAATPCRGGAGLPLQLLVLVARAAAPGGIPRDR